MRRSTGPSPTRGRRSEPDSQGRRARADQRGQPDSTARATAVPTASARTLRGMADSSANAAGVAPRPRWPADAPEPPRIEARGQRLRVGYGVEPVALSGPNPGSERRLPPSRGHPATVHCADPSAGSWWMAPDFRCGPGARTAVSRRRRGQHLDRRAGGTGRRGTPTRRRGRWRRPRPGRARGGARPRRSRCRPRSSRRRRRTPHRAAARSARPVADGHPVVAAQDAWS